MLKIGVLVDQLKIPAWLALALDEASETADFTALLVPSRLVKAKPRWSCATLLRAATEVDAWRTGVRPTLMQPVDIADPKRGMGGCSELCGPEDVSLKGLDALLVACDLPPEIVDTFSAAVPLGAIRVIIEGQNAASHSCPGAHTLLSNNPVLSVDVVISKDNRSLLLCRAEARAHRSSMSMNIDLSLRPTRNLLRDGLTKLQVNAGSQASAFAVADVQFRQPPPSWRQSTQLIAKATTRTLANQFRPRVKEQWGVGIVDTRRRGVSGRVDRQVSWANSHPSFYLADPFIVEKSGVRYIFVEELPYDRNKGHISVIVMGPEGSLSPPTKVLECDHHLSFPFVFEEGGIHFMIPEQGDAGSIMLYQAVDFPYKWTPVRTLVREFPGIDTVLHKTADRMWLFTSKGAHENHDNNLHIFSAPSLCAEFRPHRLNPVKTDIRSSRMAGKLFERNGRLYRPSQNCSIRYGGSVVISEVRTLTDETYAESFCEEIFPDKRSKFPLALHTSNAGAGAIVIDGLRNISTG